MEGFGDFPFRAHRIRGLLKAVNLRLESCKKIPLTPIYSGGCTDNSRFLVLLPIRFAYSIYGKVGFFVSFLSTYIGTISTHY